MPRNQADIGRMGTGVVCSQADEASQAQEVRLRAMPQNWRKKWERPAAIFRIANQMQPKSLPPLSAPGRLLPQVPPEQLVGRSAVARMAVDYWRNEAATAGRDVPTASPGSNAATSTTQSWTSGMSKAALSGSSSPAPSWSCSVALPQSKSRCLAYEQPEGFRRCCTVHQNVHS